MWCDHCRCEVPVDYAPESEEIRCGVCQALMPGAMPDLAASGQREPEGDSESEASVLVSRAHPTASEQREPADDLDLETRVPLVDWELQRDLRQARWLLRRSAAAISGDSCLDPPLLRITRDARRRRMTKEHRLWGTAFWLLICLGTTGLAFGGGLLGCTLVGRRGELWNLGLITALAGQLLLFLGIAGLLCLRPLMKSPNPVPPADGDASFAPLVEIPRLPWSQRWDAALTMRVDEAMA
jgi:LSD1 subclass zinc finger protein